MVDKQNTISGTNIKLIKFWEQSQLYLQIRIFGWVLVSLTGILVENEGIIQGENPDSFQAKGYGILSGLICFQIIVHIYNISIIVKLLIIYNSKSFFDQLYSSLTSTREL